MRRNLTLRTKVLLVTGVVVLFALGTRRLVFDSSPSAVIEIAGQTMGTTYSVKIAAQELTSRERDDIATLIERMLDHVNETMSTYDSTSELERFNRVGSGVPVAVSSDMMAVLSIADRVSRRTEGAFDVTAKPFVDVWGFGPVDPPITPPSDDVLAQIGANVGYELLKLDTLAGTVTKLRDNVAVDLSAIAKGYAVDPVAAVLMSNGLCCFLVEIGGELLARGERFDGSWWRVGIETPGPLGAPVLRILELRNKAVATSGDYRIYREYGGRRFAHIIDPRKGWPVPYQGLAVTVVHDEATFADAWATGLSVLGTEEAMLIAEREGLAVHIAWVSTEGVQSVATSAFDPFVVDPK